MEQVEQLTRNCVIYQQQLLEANLSNIGCGYLVTNNTRGKQHECIYN